MNNNEIIELNKKEKELDEKIKCIDETIKQYRKQLIEYKESHLEEFKDKNTQITDIHAIGSFKALKIEKAKRDALKKEKEKILEIRKEEKKKVQEKLNYVQETIKQYKKQLQEYKESHLEEFKDKNTQITDIHAIGSFKAIRIEKEKERELQEIVKLLNYGEKVEERLIDIKVSKELSNIQNNEQPKKITSKKDNSVLKDRTVVKKENREKEENIQAIQIEDNKSIKIIDFDKEKDLLDISKNKENKGIAKINKGKETSRSKIFDKIKQIRKIIKKKKSRQENTEEFQKQNNQTKTKFEMEMEKAFKESIHCELTEEQRSKIREEEKRSKIRQEAMRAMNKDVRESIINGTGCKIYRGL